MEAISSDFYDEIQPSSLVKEYHRAIKTKKEMMDYISKNHHKPFFEEYRAVVKAYLDLTI